MASRLRSAVAGFALAASFGIAAAPTLAADAVADFYGHTQVTFLVTTPPGGGNGLIALILAKHLPRFIPGKPTMVQNFMAGAGGVKGTNWMYNVAPKDGSVIGMPVASVPIAQYVVQAAGVKFDLPKFTWLGTVSRMTNVLTVWGTAPVKTIEDARRTEIIVGASGKLSWFYIEPTLMNALLGTKFKIVTGYSGSHNMNLAMERGEVQARDQHWQSLMGERPDWVRDKKVRVLVQTGLVSVPQLPGVPQFIDLVKTERERRMVKLMHATTTLGRSIFAPPGVPADRAAALRKAVADMIKDPEFIADMKSKDQDITPASAEDLQAFLDEIGSIPKSEIDEVRKLLDLKS